jgi:hypothetical protein
MKIVYIAHPLGHGSDRQGNLDAASAWVVWAAQCGVAPVATWITLAARMSEAEGRDIGLAIDVELIRRCDEIWLCGPRISPGMQIELDAAERHGLTVRRFAVTPSERPLI